MKQIFILGTGGTIAGTAAEATDLVNYTAGALSIDELIGSLPAAAELSELAAFQSEDFCRIGSEDMTPQLWLGLARRVQELADRPELDGIVITHGTDTMEETAWFLRLTVSTDKPIILTGAMLPATAPHPDGPHNLSCAIKTACSEQAVAHGVLVVMDEQIHRAAAVRKTGSRSPAAFGSPGGAVGHFEDGQPIFTAAASADCPAAFADLPRQRLAELTELPPVEIVAVYGGCSPSIPQRLLQDGAPALVFAAFGLGTLPEPIVRLCADPSYADRLLVNAASPTNALSATAYPNLIPGGIYTPKQARILLMLALAVGFDRTAVSELFAHSTDCLPDVE